MENWRDYREKEILAEANIVKYLHDGFKKLLSTPAVFDQLVQKTRQNFEEILTKKLTVLAKKPEVQTLGQEIAASINRAGEGQISEVLKEEATGETVNLSIDQLRKLGVNEEQISSLLEIATDQVSSAIIEGAAQAVGKAVPPNVAEFLKRFLKRSAKMMMFGFIDNFIMIIAGDAIDANIATTFGFSTMAAAGMGNLISDMGGEEAGEALDSAIEKMGLDVEDVSDEQMEAAPAWMRFMDKRAGSFGVAIGCIIGMFPLAFMNEEIEST